MSPVCSCPAGPVSFHVLVTTTALRSDLTRDLTGPEDAAFAGPGRSGRRARQRIGR
jgi:hypothetical protein